MGLLMTQIEYTTTERVTVVVVKLLFGEQLTTAEIASLTGMSWHGANSLMLRISRVLPIVKINKIWTVVDSHRIH